MGIIPRLRRTSYDGMTAQFQGDLFDSAPVSASVIREEEHFGFMDARSGMGLRSYYADRLSGERLAAYRRGWWAGRAAGESARAARV